jgi:hypothetical protein
LSGDRDAVASGQFRASPDFVSALARTAQKVCESKSDFIRDAVAVRVYSQAAEAPSERERTARAQCLSAIQLWSDIAAQWRVGADLVSDALTLIPDNMLTLLHSPEGWSALAEYVAAGLGVLRHCYVPTRH